MHSIETAPFWLDQTSSSPATKRRASTVFGAEKNVSAGVCSTMRPRCMSTISPATRLRFAEIVRRHHHLDAARRDGSHHVLDRLGGGRVEARGRFVEKENLRILGERAGERETLLFAAGQLAGRPLRDRFEPDQREQFGGPCALLAARDAGGVERIAQIGRGAAPQHRGALEDEGATGRGRLRSGRPR